MKMYGVTRQEISEPFVRKGDYRRYGASKRHRQGYVSSERTAKKRERTQGKQDIQQEMEEWCWLWTWPMWS